MALCGAHVKDNEERKYMNPNYELFMYSEFIIGLLKLNWSLRLDLKMDNLASISIVY